MTNRTDNFRQIEVSEQELVWLKKIASSASSDTNDLMLEFKQLVKDGLNPYQIDHRLASRGTPTLIGHWHIDQDSIIFDLVDDFIKVIQGKVSESDVKTIEIAEIASIMNLEHEQVREIHSYFREIDMHLDHDATDDSFTSLMLPRDYKLVRYLQYDNLFDLMDEQLAAQTRVFDENPFLEDQTREDSRIVKVADTAFIMMGMDSSDPLLEDAHNTYKEVCLEFGLVAKRVDDIEHAETITKVILRQIDSADLLIGDLTHARPNVYYEIGYAHAKGNNVHLFRRKGTELHFDLKIHNAPEYKNTSELRKLLIRRLSEALGRNPGS